VSAGLAAPGLATTGLAASAAAALVTSYNSCFFFFS